MLELLRDAQAREPPSTTPTCRIRASAGLARRTTPSSATPPGSPMRCTPSASKRAVGSWSGILMIVAAARGGMPDRAEIAELNQEFQICQRSSSNSPLRTSTLVGAPTLFQTAGMSLARSPIFTTCATRPDWRPEEQAETLPPAVALARRRQKLLDLPSRPRRRRLIQSRSQGPAR